MNNDPSYEKAVVLINRVEEIAANPNRTDEQKSDMFHLVRELLSCGYDDIEKRTRQAITRSKKELESKFEERQASIKEEEERRARVIAQKREAAESLAKSKALAEEKARSKLRATLKSYNECEMIDYLSRLCEAYASNDPVYRNMEPLAKEIGRKLNEVGGIGEMRRVLNKIPGVRGIRTLEMLWSGIGDWRG